MRATLLERLCKLVAHHLVLEQIKLEAALLVATSAPESGKIRGRISALAVGPPATDKTELMYATMALRPQSKMVSGAGHATGNTATAVILPEPDGTRKLHLGNVVRARHGVCGVNELDKMPPEEQNKILLEVIDKGRVSHLVNLARLATYLQRQAFLQLLILKATNGQTRNRKKSIIQKSR